MRALTILLVILLSACGEEPDPGVDPMPNGGQSGGGRGGAGKGGEGNAANDGGAGGEVDPALTCGDNEALYDGACICLPGHFGDDCSPCDCPEDTQCAEGKSGNGSCSGEKLVTCTDDAPPDATPLLEVVTVTYSEESGWPDAPPCDWVCAADTFESGDACIDSQMVACADVAPLNATSVLEDVIITYTTAGGWTDPADCDWSCDTDWFEEGGECIHTRLEPCTDASPLGAGAVWAEVITTYTTEDGFSTPADCDWTCLEGFREVGETCVTAPIVIGSTPEADGIAPDGALTIDFSEAMDTSSVEQAIEVTPDVNLLFAWSQSATRLTITPDGTWDNQLLYSIHVSTGAKDLAGNALEQAFDLDFYGAAWVMFYGSTGTTNGNLIARAQGLALADGSARIAADALCGAPAFASVPGACSSSAAFLSVNVDDEARDLPTSYGLHPDSEVRTPGDQLIEAQWSGLFDGVLGGGAFGDAFQYNGVFPNDDQNHLYWTGSNTDGTYNSGGSESACNNWTDGTTAYFASHGWAWEANFNWIDRAGIACQNIEHLLCACW